MAGYELVMVLHPRLEDAEVDAFVEKVGRWISEKDGSLLKVDRWGRRKLAYPIKRLMEGNYILTQFQGEPQRVAGLEDNLKLSEEVIRYLLVKAELREEPREEAELREEEENGKSE